MNNDWGVYTEAENGVITWVTDQDPLTLGSEEDAIDNLSYADAITISNYLTSVQGGATFAPGRPKDRQPS